MMGLFTAIFLLAGLLCSHATAQSTILNEQVLSSFIYTVYGDRTPLILPQEPTLTPLGAQQLYNAGQTIRNRYIGTNGSDTSGTAILGISPYILDNQAISILTTSDQHLVASASAFMQGLYPPLELSSSNTFATDISVLANGSTVTAPLSNYQYAQLYTASPLDLNSIWINGMYNCPAYTAASNEYWNSDNYVSLLNANSDFYASLIPGVLGGIFPLASVGYYDAFEIWDYVQYGVTHNSTVADAVSDTDMVKLRLLADNAVFAQNCNTSSAASIAGRTLATRMIESLYSNINTLGAYQQMTLFFGSFEPLMAFFALAGLPSMQNQQFYSIPEQGASMVVELFTLVVDGESSAYPSDASNLFVRFLYQNGTGNDAEMTQYPLFGADPDNMYVSFSDFVAGIEPIMMLSIEDWCSQCGSYSVFCPAFEGENDSPRGTDLTSSTHRLNPALAGVIGALVTLVVLALIVGAAMLLLGLRFFRVKNKRRSELAGFKGAEKLASDQDLTIPKGGAGAVVTDTGAAAGRGHERIGSWELRHSGKVEEAHQPMDHIASKMPRRPSFEDDELHVNPYSKPVQAKDQL